jgi:hypothetical protein
LASSSGEIIRDQPHLAAHDVDQLRQLVEAVLPEEASDRRHPRIGDQLVLRFECGSQRGVAGQDLIGVGDHRPELQRIECLAALADDAAPMKDRPAAADQDEDAEHQEERRHQQQRQRRERSTDRVLDRRVPPRAARDRR